MTCSYMFQLTLFLAKSVQEIKLFIPNLFPRSVCASQSIGIYCIHRRETDLLVWVAVRIPHVRIMFKYHKNDTCTIPCRAFHGTTSNWACMGSSNQIPLSLSPKVSKYFRVMNYWNLFKTSHQCIHMFEQQKTIKNMNPLLVGKRIRPLCSSNYSSNLGNKYFLCFLGLFRLPKVRVAQSHWRFNIMFLHRSSKVAWIAGQHEMCGFNIHKNCRGNITRGLLKDND